MSANPALASSPQRLYITKGLRMQSINVVVINPWFMTTVPRNSGGVRAGDCLVSVAMARSGHAVVVGRISRRPC
jgi:uncharacterized membrane protein